MTRLPLAALLLAAAAPLGAAGAAEFRQALEREFRGNLPALAGYLQRLEAAPPFRAVPPPASVAPWQAEDVWAVRCRGDGDCYMEIVATAAQVTEQWRAQVDGKLAALAADAPDAAELERLAGDEGWSPLGEGGADGLDLGALAAAARAEHERARAAAGEIEDWDPGQETAEEYIERLLGRGSR